MNFISHSFRLLPFQNEFVFVATVTVVIVVALVRFCVVVVTVVVGLVVFCLVVVVVAAARQWSNF